MNNEEEIKKLEKELYGIFSSRLTKLERSMKYKRYRELKDALNEEGEKHG